MLPLCLQHRCCPYTCPMQAVALSRQAQPEVRLLERVVEKEVPDAAALRALEARLVAAEAERHELQRCEG